jgi:hypothetical protein
MTKGLALKRSVRQRSVTHLKSLFTTCGVAMRRWLAPVTLRQRSVNFGLA